jgi:hypothetical protein
VRRVPDLRPRKDRDQGTLFDIWRFHAFFTTTDPDDLDTIAADKLHRHHAIIEQVHADLKNSALTHLPSGRFTANAAWLVCAVMAFNLTRAAGTLTGDPKLTKATTGTIRRTLVGNSLAQLVRHDLRSRSADHRLTPATPAHPRRERPSGTGRQKWSDDQLRSHTVPCRTSKLAATASENRCSRAKPREDKEGLA